MNTLDTLLNKGISQRFVKNAKIMAMASGLLISAVMSIGSAQAFDLGQVLTTGAASAVAANLARNAGGGTVSQITSANMATEGFRPDSASRVEDRSRYERAPRYEQRNDYQQQPYRVQPENNSGGGVINTSTVVGGVLGGLMGSRFGNGNGKTAAAVAGAIVGGVIGNEMDGGRREASAPQNHPNSQAGYRGGEILQYTIPGSGRTYQFKNGNSRLSNDDVRSQGLMGKVEQAVQARFDFEGRRQAAVFGQSGNNGGGNVNDFEWKSRAAGVMDNIQTAAVDYNIDVKPFVAALSDGLQGRHLQQNVSSNYNNPMR